MGRWCNWEHTASATRRPGSNPDESTMKVKKTELKGRTVVSSSNLAHIEASEEEINELVASLKVIEKFKHAARKACKVNDSRRFADWTEYHFEIHRREGEVIVDIKQGMAG